MGLGTVIVSYSSKPALERQTDNYSLQELTFLFMAGHEYLLRPEAREPLDSVAKWAMPDVDAAWEENGGIMAIPLWAEVSGGMLGRVTDDTEGAKAVRYKHMVQNVTFSNV